VLQSPLEPFEFKFELGGSVTCTRTPGLKNDSEMAAQK
jgi:hypothetical protein